MTASTVLELDPSQPVSVFLPRKVIRKIKAYIAVVPEEVSGIGDVVVRGDRLVVTDVFLLEQESSVAHTTLFRQALNAFATERLMTNGDAATLKLWWHSHGALPVYWSTTDEAAIASMAHSGWWLSIVGNHATEYLARLDLFPSEHFPFRITIPAELNEIDGLTHTELAQAKREVAQKVKTPEKPDQLQPHSRRRRHGLPSPAGHRQP